MELPKGIVTIVFTDIQGSTDLWEKLGNKFKPVLEVNDSTVEIKLLGSSFLGMNERFFS